MAVTPGSVTTVADLAPGTASLDVAVGGPAPGTDPVAGASVTVARADVADDRTRSRRWPRPPTSTAWRASSA
ncbi:MAG: hypothetical protein R2690_20280 [Acidimicrobiales bacterium]